MEWLQNVLDTTQIPILSAFILGLLTALSPCPLATNITAVGYIGKEIDNKRHVFVNGLIYTLGRVVSYTLLGVVLIFLLKEGAGIFGIQKFLARYGAMLLPPVLILVGLFILFSDKLKLPSFGFKGDGEGLQKHGSWGAFLLGALFALAFCPTSAVFYFGMLIPMSATATAGYVLPAVFAVATGLPVAVVAWFLAFSMSSVSSFYGKMKSFQKWFSIVVGILCLIVGVYYLIILLF
jgi:cytochrome c biogenesis protein CcdA